MLTLCTVGLPALFLPYARDAIEDGLLEVQRVEPDSDKRRTWFVEQEVVSGACHINCCAAVELLQLTTVATRRAF